MAKLSRNQRHKARQRRMLSVLKREFRKLYQQHHNTAFALLSLLQAAEENTIVISGDVLKTVLPKLQYVSWKSERLENGDVKITMVDNTPEVAEEQPTADNVTIRYVDDDGVAVDRDEDDQTDTDVDGQ